MALLMEATAQEAVLIRGSIIEETTSYYWIVDDSGNRLAVTWRKDFAEKLVDALDTIESIDGMNSR